MITMGLWDITINYYLLLMLHYHYCTLQHCSCSLTAQRIPISRSHPSKGPLAPASPIPAVDRCGGTRSRTRRSEGDVRCKTVLETPCFFFSMVKIPLEIQQETVTPRFLMANTCPGWWFEPTPLKNMSSSVGMMKFPYMKWKINNIWNHQPVFVGL